MSDTVITETLARSVQQVLSTMCFSEVWDAESSELPASTAVVAASVSFFGTRSGRLELAVSSEAACDLTDAFLGSPDPHTRASGEQPTICELGTMVCGRLLSSLDPTGQLNLATAAAGTAAERNGEVISRGFLLDSGHLTVSVQFD